MLLRVLVAIHHGEHDRVGHPVRHLAVDVERLGPRGIIRERADWTLLALGIIGRQLYREPKRRHRRAGIIASEYPRVRREAPARLGLVVVEGVYVILDQMVALGMVAIRAAALLVDEGVGD